MPSRRAGAGAGHPGYAPDGHGAIEIGAPPGLRARIDAARGPLNDLAQYRMVRIGQPSSERKRYAVVEAERDGVRVMLKAFWDEPTMERAIRTLHETRVYRHLHFNGGGATGGLPNMVPWVETVRVADCDAEAEAAAARPRSAARAFWSQLAALKRPELGEDLVVLITEFATGTVTLADFVQSRQARREGVMTAVIVQLVHALHLLHRRGVTHNDLHAGNVLIRPSGTEGTLMYCVGGHERTLPPGVPKVLIFDLDLAACARCGKNELTDPCEHRGVCDQSNPRFDVYMAARFLLKYAPLDRDERAFLTQVVPRKLYEEASSRMCRRPSARKRRASGARCEKWPRGQPKDVMSIHDAVNLPFIVEKSGI